MHEAEQKPSRPKAGLGSTLAPWWRSLGSPRTPFYLLVAIAICSVIGILIPQGQLPDYYVRAYGKLGASVILPLGVDHLYTSTWYVLLLALLPLSVVAGAKHIWRSAGDNFTSPQLDGAKRRWLVGRKWRYTAFGIPIIHFSVLIIAVGAVLGHWPGLAVTKMIEITEGETYKDPDGDFDFALKLNDFSIEYYPDRSTVKAYRSDFSVWERGQEVKRKTIVVNRPLSYDHFSFFQSGWGLAGFALKVTPANGAVETAKFPLVVAAGSERDHTRHYQLPLPQPRVLIGDGQAAIIATAFVPDAWEQDGQIIGSRSEFPNNPAARITLASSSITGRLELTDLGWVKPGQPAVYNGGTIQLTDVQHYASIMVRRDYGVPLVWFGFITLFVGLVTTFYLRPHTIAARLTDTGEQTPPTQRSIGSFWANNLPSLDVLDQLTYRLVGFAFPLLTLVIITGAVWAQVAWGRWWHWDPKETAALVTWLIYAAYLHGRLRPGWRGAPAAAFAILGFATVLFCFAGIKFVPSLHSHAGSVAREGGRLVLGGFAGISPTEIWLSQGFIGAYVLAMVAYFAFAATGNSTIGKTATVLVGIGLLTLTAVLGLRTYEAGRLPLTSSYDFALCFIWCTSIAHLVVERIMGTKVLGAFVITIVLGLTMYAYLLLPAKVSTPLMPALQNRFWLHFHVLVAIIAFGALALSCATGIMYFVKRKAVATATNRRPGSVA